MFRKLLDTGEAGDNIGALLRGIERDQVERGQVLAHVGSITPHTKFKCEAYVLKKKRVADILLSLQIIVRSFILELLTLLEFVSFLMELRWLCLVTISQWKLSLLHQLLWIKVRFAIREGGRTVGSGVVTEIIS